MSQPQPVTNPFALMTNPQAVFAALERSDLLSRLQSRICRPLDRPLIDKVDAEQSAFDATVDAAGEAAVDAAGEAAE